MQPCFSLSWGLACFFTGRFLVASSCVMIADSRPLASSWTRNCHGEGLSGPLFHDCTSIRKRKTSIFSRSEGTITGLCWTFSLSVRRLILSLRREFCSSFEMRRSLLFLRCSHCCLSDVQWNFEIKGGWTAVLVPLYCSGFNVKPSQVFIELRCFHFQKLCCYLPFMTPICVNNVLTEKIWIFSNKWMSR